MTLILVLLLLPFMFADYRCVPAHPAACQGISYLRMYPDVPLLSCLHTPGYRASLCARSIVFLLDV